MSQLISLFNVQPIASELAQQQLFLTPNQRLASRMINAYAIFCKQHGHSVVVAPRVYSYSQWLEQCWQQLLMMAYPPAIDRKLLSQHEQLIILERLITESEQGAVLLRPGATAQQLAGALDALYQSQLAINDEAVSAYFDTEDSQIVKGWLLSYQDYCQQQAYYPPSEKALIVKRALDEQILDKEKIIHLTSFDTLSPLQQQLLKSASQEVIEIAAACHAKPSQQVVACETQDEEILGAALWAKRQLRNANDSNNLPTLAVVIPTLNQQRAKVERIFTEVFMPDAALPGCERQSLPFNISAGERLLEQPIIAAAIKGLELNNVRMDCDELIQILQSPFYAFTTDHQHKLTALSYCLKAEKSKQVKLARLRYLVEKQQGEEEESALLQRLLLLFTQFKSINQNKTQFCEQWAQHFGQLLQLTGWPGQRNPNSLEYQALTQWQQQLQQFATLSDVLGPIKFSEALQQFKQLLNSAVFQAQSKESPLQLLGLLEASGLQFDAIWLCGMSEKEWPPAPSPNPLLPYALQQYYDMPNATAQRELLLSQKISQRFSDNAKQLFVSFAKYIDDNPCAVSRLYSPLPVIELPNLLNKSVGALHPQQEIIRRFRESGVLETFTWGDAPAVSEQEIIKGGSSLFTNQSACPFKAFATHRLGLKAYESAVTGLDKSVKGNLIHRALELIWKQLQSSAELLALSEDEQAKLCHNYADFVLNEYGHRLAEPMGLRHQQIESQRLAQLLSAWLNVERERASFTVVAREEKKTFKFAQLELTGRVDRVDELADGSQLVIDYKTGNSSISSWWGDRPDQPQLPLYSNLLDQEGKTVSAIAFAQVNLESCAIKGVGDEAVSERSLAWNAKVQSLAGQSSWQQLKSHWQQVLTALANDFITGKADVDPKNPANSCQYCDLAALCRIEHQNDLLVEEVEI